MGTYWIKSSFKVKPSIVDISPVIQCDVLNGMKLIHISDLHINQRTPIDEIEFLVDTINSTEASYVVISGDIIDCRVCLIQDKLQVLQKIYEKKVFFVSGNHDCFHDYVGLRDIFASMNFISLDNSYYIISHNGSNILMWGLSDRFSKFFGIRRDEDRLTEEIRKLEIPKIFISHQPKDYQFGIKTGSSVFLTGHTHGGQIFPFNFAVRLFQPFVSGLYYVRNLAIYVNRGIGSWGIGYRFCVKQEIAVIRIVSFF